MLQKIFYPGAAILMSFFSLFCGNAGTTTHINAAAENNDSAIRPTGAIAYIRDASEIRLIDSNGKNDRSIWTHPDAKDPLGLHDLAWRPDGKELAFSSSHEALYSVYDADIYAIHPDGTGFRKITNAPAHQDYDK